MKGHSLYKLGSVVVVVFKAHNKKKKGHQPFFFVKMLNYFRWLI